MILLWWKVKCCCKLSCQYMFHTSRLRPYYHSWTYCEYIWAQSCLERQLRLWRNNWCPLLQLVCILFLSVGIPHFDWERIHYKFGLLYMTLGKFTHFFLEAQVEFWDLSHHIGHFQLSCMVRSICSYLWWLTVCWIEHKLKYYWPKVENHYSWYVIFHSNVIVIQNFQHRDNPCEMSLQQAPMYQVPNHFLLGISTPQRWIVVSHLDSLRIWHYHRMSSFFQ